MPLVDVLEMFSNAQAITAAAASTSYKDLSLARDIGIGQELFVQVTVDTAFTDSGSNSTLSVDIQYDSSTTFTPDDTQLGIIIPALAAAGSTYYFRVNPMKATMYRYMQLYYTPNNGDLSAGAVSAYLVMSVQKNVSYPNAITIS